MLSPKTRRNLYRIIPFGMMWLIFSVVYVLLERGLLGYLDYYPSTGNPYNFTRNIFITPLAALVTGLLIGLLETRYFTPFFLHKTFSKKILYKSLSYLVIILVFLVVLNVIGNIHELRTTVLDLRVWNYVWAFLMSYAFLSILVYISSIIIVTQFYNEVSENIGRGVLLNFFTGKYHTPTQEERIYMFLDMKSSTAIAEHLGHVRYFDMLREYYADLSEPIIQYAGQIYQYVGDEVVVTWKLKSGLHDNNCIRCFFAMKEALRQQAGKYTERYGLLPEFKAGLHLGKVTTGEIGVIKKEIIFTGDVLNTAARIQGLCNSYQVDLLLSGDLLHRLDLPATFYSKSFGATELRGRDEKIELFTILAG